MRFSLIFLPFVLLAQTPAPAPKAAPKKAPTAAKPATAAPKPATGATKAAAPKPAGAKPAAAAKPKPATGSAVVPTTEDDKIVYSLGLLMARSLERFELSTSEMAMLKQALDDAKAGKPAVELQEYGPKIDAFARGRADKQSAKEKETSRLYLEKAAAEPGAQKTESGLVYKDLMPGSGASPAATDTVKVHYRGTLVNGTEFDSSYKRNEPAQFALNQVIRCWTEGVQKMKVGGKARLVCPSDIAYGDQGRPSIPGGAALIFDIELLDVVKATP